MEANILNIILPVFGTLGVAGLGVWQKISTTKITTSVSIQNETVIKKIDGLSNDVTRLVDDLNVRTIDSESMKKFRDKSSYYISQFRYQCIKDAAVIKVNAYINDVKENISLDFDNLNDFDRIKNGIQAQTIQVYETIKPIIGTTLADIFHKQHESDTLMYIHKVKKIFERLKNHKLEDYLELSHEYMVGFLKVMLTLNPDMIKDVSNS